MAISTFTPAATPTFTSNILSSVYLTDLDTQLKAVGLTASTATPQLNLATPGALVPPTLVGIKNAVYYSPLIYVLPVGATTGVAADPTVVSNAVTVETYDSTKCSIKLIFGMYLTDTFPGSTSYATTCKIEVGYQVNPSGAWLTPTGAIGGKYVSYESTYPVISNSTSIGVITQTITGTKSYIQNTGKNFTLVSCPGMTQVCSTAVLPVGYTLPSSTLAFINIHRDNGNISILRTAEDDNDTLLGKNFFADFIRTTITPTSVASYEIVLGQPKDINGLVMPNIKSDTVRYFPVMFSTIGNDVTMSNNVTVYQTSTVTYSPGEGTIQPADIQYPSGVATRNVLHLGKVSNVYNTTGYGKHYSYAVVYE